MKTALSAPAPTVSSPPPADTWLDRRLDGRPAWAVVLEAFFGLGWLRAGVEKIIEPEWWNGDQLATFLAEHEGGVLEWFQPVIDGLVVPFSGAVLLAVPLIQVVLGLALLSGRMRVPALLAGIGLNLVFIAAGAVNPSIFYILAQGAVLLWAVERDRSGKGLAALDIAAGAGVFLASASVLSIRTIHPAEVVDDPAMIMITLAGLLVLARLVIGRQHVLRARARDSRQTATSRITGV